MISLTSISAPGLGQGVHARAVRPSTGTAGEEVPGPMVESLVPTVRDVAQLAGVSPGTVSKALNGRGQLRAETRRRVQAAADQLGFRPNQLAKSLIEGRSYTVGVLTTDSFGRFTMPLMMGIENSLGAGQVSTMLCDSRADPMRERHYVHDLLSRR